MQKASAISAKFDEILLPKMAASERNIDLTKAGHRDFGGNLNPTEGDEVLLPSGCFKGGWK
ncbi:MAG: hypothetical protein M0T74_08060 [Desulfitobacterium hafniense]|nr:hypothetical protein [Desulfitobacterium hafniense]